jgi:hypothetical protein
MRTPQVGCCVCRHTPPRVAKRVLAVVTLAVWVVSVAVSCNLGQIDAGGHGHRNASHRERRTRHSNASFPPSALYIQTEDGRRLESVDKCGKEVEGTRFLYSL